jgi:hypothetical protein
MKVCKVSLFVALMAVCLPAVAQTEMRCNIPFNFFVAGNSLPAGHYTVVRETGLDSDVWRIFTDHATLWMLTSSAEEPRKAHRPSLLFLQAGGVYSLVQFWPTGYSGRQVPREKVQRIFVAEGDKYVEIGAE